MTKSSSVRNPDLSNSGRRSPTQWTLQHLFGLTAVVALLCAACISLDIKYFLKTNGFVGWALVAVGIILMLVGFFLFFTVSNRKTFVLYGVASFLPLTLGLLGTWLGHQSIQFVKASGGVLDQDMLNEGYRVAWSTTYMGFAFCMAAVVTACMGFAVSRR